MSRTLTFPTARPEDLSEDAQTVYRAPLVNNKLGADPFAPRQRYHYVSREDADAYVPSERVLTAIKELEAAGLATYDAKYGWLSKKNLHPLYTVARGRGPFFAQVRLVPLDRASMPDESGSPLLATLTGATFDRRDSRQGSPWATWTLQTRHPTATDFEHDASKVAYFEIVNPVSQPIYSGGYQTWIGTLTGAQMYPWGVDPTTVYDPNDDTKPGMCTDHKDYYGEDHEDHPFAPYSPPRREDVEALVPSIVVVTLYPLVAYNVAGEAPVLDEE